MKEKNGKYDHIYCRDLISSLWQNSGSLTSKVLKRQKRTYYLTPTSLWTLSHCSGSSSVPVSEFRSFRGTPAMFTPRHTGTKRKTLKNLLHGNRIFLKTLAKLVIAQSSFQLRMCSRTIKHFRCLSPSSYLLTEIFRAGPTILSSWQRFSK